MIADDLRQWLEKSLATMGFGGIDFVVEHPTELTHGDYATNVALAVAKQHGQNPREIAEKIASELSKNKLEAVEKITTAGPGFINFFLSPQFFADSLNQIIKEGGNFGQNKILANEKIIIEHTQPNPFKEFHIGHLMNNAIGESVARIIAASGAEVKTASYHGDVGLHVAKAIWAIQKNNISSDQLTVVTLGQMYAAGATAYENDPQAKEEIVAINKKIYDQSDPTINTIYNDGRKLSLDYFNSLYGRLDSHFDFSFYESDGGEVGKRLVLAHPEVFVESEGAVVFKGELYGLHTRVFLNSEKLPTYEAKELGLAQIKKDLYSYTRSLTVTGNEQDDFFKVVEVAIGEVFPGLKGKLTHLPHGMLRLPSGKMSSRTGDVITAESLIEQAKEKVLAKIKDREMDADQKEVIAEAVAIGAIKYSILKQAIGGDIVFDFDKSLSFEGDSGPYLQYTYARANSVLEKAGKKPDVVKNITEMAEPLKLLYRFPEIVAHAGAEFAPHYIAHYLQDLAASFNAYYANHSIIDSADPSRLALTSAIATVLKTGLHLLGIQAPEKM